MTDAVATLRVYTGTDAGTESGAQVGIDLISADNALNSSGNRTAHEVAPGSNSYEKWMRVRIDTANGHTLTDFWITRTGDLPDGVILKMGVTDDPATPVATLSTVATTTMHDDRKYIFDTNEYSADGDHTRYLVLQEQAAGSAPSGAIDTGDFVVGWTQS